LTSEAFIKLAIELLNVSDLSGFLENLSKEERKEVDFEWIHKDLKPQTIPQPQPVP